MMPFSHTAVLDMRRNLQRNTLKNSVQILFGPELIGDNNIVATNEIASVFKQSSALSSPLQPYVAEGGTLSIPSSISSLRQTLI